MTRAFPPGDSQGPRWEVFKQDAAGRPHQAIGTVHAADAEHALLTARTVFARRPRALSLWVAPADACVLVTAEAEREGRAFAETTAPFGGASDEGTGIGNATDNATDDATAGAPDGTTGGASDETTGPSTGGKGAAPAPRWQVFAKRSHRPSLHLADHLGEVRAADAPAALAAARSAWPDAAGALAWLLVPDGAIVRSDPADADSWFGPAEDKRYKQQSAYGFVKPQTGEQGGNQTGNQTGDPTGDPTGSARGSGGGRDATSAADADAERTPDARHPRGRSGRRSAR